MDTEKKLNTRILKLLTTIREKYPELQHFICSKPVLIPRPKYPDTNIRNLTEYYNALDVLVKNYVYNSGSFPVSRTPDRMDVKFIISSKSPYSAFAAS